MVLLAIVVLHMVLLVIVMLHMRLLVTYVLHVVLLAIDACGISSHFTSAYLFYNTAMQ